MIQSCLIILATLCSLSSSQQPPMWGGNPVYTVQVGMQNDNPALNWTFTYYYDWKLKVERYAHQAPQADIICMFVGAPFTVNESCTVVMATDGWMYVQYPAQDWCCKCSSFFKSIRYDWLQENSTYVGREIVHNYLVNHWTKQGSELNHYYSTVDEALPVRFFEFKKGNPKSWNFDLSTYSTAPINPDLFKPPCSNLCEGQCPSYRQNYANLFEDI